MKLSDFVEEGTCSQVGGEMFFTDSAGDSTSRQAKKVCIQSCPVVSKCFVWAMSQGVDLAGTWAGTTERERRVAHVARNSRRAA